MLFYGPHARDRSKDSPAALECELIEVKRLTDRHDTTLDFWLVPGEVVCVNLDEAFVRAGVLDMAAMRPIARCSYEDHLVADEVFQMGRPQKSVR